MIHRVALMLFVILWLLFPLSLMAGHELVSSIKADRVVVSKTNKTLILLKGEHILKEYRISLGRNPEGHKERQGDSRTPEGEYVLDWRNPRSKFHRSIHISYPNENDMANARKLGVEPGGNIMIHGLPKGMGWLGGIHAYINWTDGCIAVTNEEMEEIWEYVPDGTPIQISS